MIVNQDNPDNSPLSTQSPRAKAVTLKDIAARCGVAVSTVSFALRNDPRVIPATAERIRAIATEMGYDPQYHDFARRLVGVRSGLETSNHVVALFFPSWQDRPPSTYFLQLLTGVMSGLMTQGYALL
ncbi:MAG TPA: LacI family DNA-binding transcriptional regulator, partial [Armatimonadota bacterium]